MTLRAEPWGRAAGGAPVTLVTLEEGGLRVRLSSYGARVVSLEAPDRDGRCADVTLGLDALAAYEASPACFGAVVGRYGNRIAGARIVVDGVVHRLDANEGAHHLHGGRRGFDRAAWRVEPVAPAGGGAGAAVVFHHESAAGDQGYPGRLLARARYALLPEGELRLLLEAECDAPTPVSLVHHPYWNLGGASCACVDDHELEVRAGAYLPVDGARLPTGEIRDAAGTSFDLRRGGPLGARSFDHCFLLRPPGGAPAEGSVALAARLREPSSGRTLEIRTDAPALQVYTGEGIPPGVGRGRAHGPRAALCLEPESPPDAPNRPAFGPALLRPGVPWRRQVRYRLSTS